MKLYYLIILLLSCNIVLATNLDVSYNNPNTPHVEILEPIAEAIPIAPNVSYANISNASYFLIDPANEVYNNVEQIDLGIYGKLALLTSYPLNLIGQVLGTKNSLWIFGGYGGVFNNPVLFFLDSTNPIDSLSLTFNLANDRLELNKGIYAPNVTTDYISAKVLNVSIASNFYGRTDFINGQVWYHENSGLWIQSEISNNPSVHFAGNTANGYLWYDANTNKFGFTNDYTEGIAEADTFIALYYLNSTGKENLNNTFTNNLNVTQNIKTTTLTSVLTNSTRIQLGYSILPSWNINLNGTLAHNLTGVYYSNLTNWNLLQAD